MEGARPVRSAGLFYGWVIVAVVFVTSTVAGGIGSCVQSVFFEPMRASLGMSNVALSAVTSTRTVAMALSAPVLGPFVDKRWGARLFMTAGAVAGGLALVSLVAVRSPWQLFLALGVVFGFSQALLGSQVIAPVVVAKWFVRYRGRAMAIAVMGISAGCVLMTPVSRWLIATLEWRGAWVVLGSFMIVVIAPLAAATIRRQPEDMGLRPDGAGGPQGTPGDQATERSPQPAAEEASYTLREALRMPAAWLLTAVQMLVSFGTGPVLLHQVPYMVDKGFSPNLAATVVTVFGLASLSAKPVYGILAEHIPGRYLAMFAFTGAGAGLGFLIYADSVPWLFAFAIGYGLNFGSFVLLMNIIWADYFGRGALGAIRGFFAPAAMVASATGPILGGLLRDRYESFDMAFTIYALAWLAAVAMMLLAKPPRARAAPRP